MFCYSSPSMAKASSLTLPNPNHSLPIFLHPPSSSNLPFPFPQSSSNSQFIGLKLSSSHSSSFSVPSSSFKGSIVAKVSKGSKPPAFTLRDQDGKTVSLTKFKGKPVVVYFYPADETPGCTKQKLYNESLPLHCSNGFELRTASSRNNATVVFPSILISVLIVISIYIFL